MITSMRAPGLRADVTLGQRRRLPAAFDPCDEDDRRTCEREGQREGEDGDLPLDAVVDDGPLRDQAASSRIWYGPGVRCSAAKVTR